MKPMCHFLQMLPGFSETGRQASEGDKGRVRAAGEEEGGGEPAPELERRQLGLRGAGVT